MRAFLRANALCSLFALAGCLTLAWLGLVGYAWSDYEVEAQPSLQALTAGHVGDFLRLAPAYGGSLIERAPFALLPSLWGGGALAVYRAVAVPCLLATAALGVWLVSDMRARGATRLARSVTLGICVANPITLKALEVGHPEDLLGAVLVLAALLIAARPNVSARSALAAGVLLGLAVANKEWALIAVGPVLLTLAPRRRALALISCVLAAGVVLAPLLLVSKGSFVTAARSSASTSSQVFQPWQIWWFIGHHGAPVHGLFGDLKPAFRTAPSWVGAISHPSVLLAGAAVAVALWPRARRVALREDQALLALALVLLLRCLLDTWDTSYYIEPFLLALLAWEVRRPGASAPPLLTLACSGLAWLSFVWLSEHAVGDVQAAVFLAWSLPFAAWLGLRLLARGTSPAGERGSADGRGQETTVRAFDRLVSTS